MNKKIGFTVKAFTLACVFLVTIACIPNLRITVLGQVGTSVGGHISVNTTWTIGNSPYIVEETVVVEPDVTLSIEPGVEVRFSDGTELVVDGALSAIGDAANYITFTSNATAPASGDWGGIEFEEMSDDAACIVDWAIVRYASTGVYAYGSSPAIRNSVIEYNSNFGIYSSSVTIFIDDLGVPMIDNCTISDNGGIPIDVNKQGGVYVKFGGIDIQNSSVENNLGYGIVSVGSNAESVLAERISIENNTGTGVSGDITIVNSKIMGNQQSGIISDSSIHYNSIFGNTPYDLVVESGDNLDASLNWWGTVNETLIQESIYDYYDDFNLGIATYKPYISSPYFVYYDEQVYEEGIISNSSITDFEFSQPAKTISFTVNGTTGTAGFCNISIPSGLMWGNFTLYMDATLLTKDVDYTETSNGTHYLFSINYEHSSHTIELVSTDVIPDFAGWLFLPFVTSATLLALALRKSQAKQRKK